MYVCPSKSCQPGVSVQESEVVGEATGLGAVGEATGLGAVGAVGVPPPHAQHASFAVCPKFSKRFP